MARPPTGRHLPLLVVLLFLCLLALATAQTDVQEGGDEGNESLGNVTERNQTDETGTNATGNTTPGGGGPQATLGPPDSSPWPPILLIVGLSALIGVLVARTTMRRGG